MTRNQKVLQVIMAALCALTLVPAFVVTGVLAAVNTYRSIVIACLSWNRMVQEVASWS